MRSSSLDAFPAAVWSLAAVPTSGLDYFWQAEPQWLALWLAILAIFITLAYYVIGKVRPKSERPPTGGGFLFLGQFCIPIGKTRPKSVQKEQPASDWLTKCRESHAKGVLSDEEFRTIKTKLAERLQDELNDNDDEG